MSGRPCFRLRLLAASCCVVTALAAPVLLAGCTFGGTKPHHLNSTGRHRPVVTIPLVAAPVSLRRSCAKAARKLKTVIYCPLRVPAKWTPQFLCAGCNGTFGATGYFEAPRGYIGSRTPGETTGHFTVWAATHDKIRDGYVGCVNRPTAGHLRVRGRTMAWIVCPPGSSLDGGHVLLVWSQGGWKYALSLHSDTPTNRMLLSRIARHLLAVRD